MAGFMSTRNYSRSSGRMGGTGSWVSDKCTGSLAYAPEVARDCKLINDAFVKFRDKYMRSCGAAHASGHGYTSADRTWSWLKSYVSLYNRRPNRLSFKVRKFCMDVLQLKELPPVEVVVPEGLRYLPKRPPSRNI